MVTTVQKSKIRAVPGATFLLLLSVLAAVDLAAQRRRPALPRGIPTFSRDVAPILQEKCQSCHRSGGIAPFPLVTYADTVTRATLVMTMTGSRQMPPWKPVEDCGSFEGSLALSEAQITLISDWVKAGGPEGDPRDLPPARVFPDRWVSGEPDEVVALAETFVPDSHDDGFQCFVMPRTFNEERFVRGIDFAPTARSMVHHILAYVDATGTAQTLDEGDPGPGYSCFGGPGFPPATILGAWFPGAAPLVLPADVALKVPANSRIVLQIHYHPHHGRTEPDRTEMGIYYAPAPPRRLFEYLLAENRDFTIPAGATNHRVTARHDISAPIRLINVGAHAHWLGRKAVVDAVFPDGRRECLLRIDDWDPKWQGMYTFRDPVDLPAGTRIEVEFLYDNSASNPRNPHSPPVDISYGEKATEEMCSAYLGYVAIP
jgi:hypothetical protein